MFPEKKKLAKIAAKLKVPRYLIIRKAKKQFIMLIYFVISKITC